jgi:hypothetical protein
MREAEGRQGARAGGSGRVRERDDTGLPLQVREVPSRRRVVQLRGRRYNQNGTPVGDAEFDADPDALHPGDSIRATDSFADGWGVTAHLSTGRSISTRGHDSP